MKTDRNSKLGRRDVLRALGAGALGAGIATSGTLTTQSLADSENNDEKRKARYQETDHVKAYYRVNRYPR